jgi:Mor family transcriptional regulator
MLPKSAQEIIDIVGHDAAMKLFESYGGTVIYIPKNISWFNKIRNQKIISDRRSGVSPSMLSIKYNINIRSIFAICKVM